MDKQELVDFKNSLDKLHKSMCNLFAKYPESKELQKATVEIGYTVEYLNKKIEALN